MRKHSTDENGRQLEDKWRDEMEASTLKQRAFNEREKTLKVRLRARCMRGKRKKKN